MTLDKAVTEYVDTATMLDRKRGHSEDFARRMAYARLTGFLIASITLKKSEDATAASLEILVQELLQEMQELQSIS